VDDVGKRTSVTTVTQRRHLQSRGPTTNEEDELKTLLALMLLLVVIACVAAAVLPLRP
jgi:hypothetical protein